MHLFAVVCAVAVGTAMLGVGVANAASSSRVRQDARCDVLAGAVPAAVRVTTGDVIGARHQAKALRDLADRELTPRKVKPALRKLAAWFAAARGRSVVKRATTLSALQGAIATVVEWYADICAGVPTTSTTRPLR